LGEAKEELLYPVLDSESAHLVQKSKAILLITDSKVVDLPRSGAGTALSGDNAENAPSVGPDPGMSPSPQRKPLLNPGPRCAQACSVQPVPGYGLVRNDPARKEME